MTNPLNEAEPNSLAELMARDPLKLTDQDLDLIIAELRRKRVDFAKAEAEPKIKKPRGTAKANISLDDIGL